MWTELETLNSKPLGPTAQEEAGIEKQTDGWLFAVWDGWSLFHLRIVPVVFCFFGFVFVSVLFLPLSFSTGLCSPTISQPPHLLLIRAIICIIHLPRLGWSAVDSVAQPPAVTLLCWFIKEPTVLALCHPYQLHVCLCQSPVKPLSFVSPTFWPFVFALPWDREEVGLYIGKT